MSKVINITAIPDSEYDMILALALKKDFICKIKNDKEARFYMDNNKLYCETKIDGKVCEVISLYEAMKIKDEIAENSKNEFKNSVINKMISEYPDLPIEDINANADIVNEGNEAIKRLIESGLQPDIAYKIILATLHSDESNLHIINELEAKNAVFTE